MDNHGMTLSRDANFAIDQHPSSILTLSHTQKLSQHHQDDALLHDYLNQQFYYQDDNNEVATERNHDLTLLEYEELNLVENQGLGDDHTLDNKLAVAPFPQLVASSDQQPTIGQEFPDANSCRRAIRDAAIACHFEIQTVKSDKTRFTAKCSAEGCSWRIHAAKLPNAPTFKIRSITDNHTCSGLTHLGHHQASVQWVANTVEEKLRENPDYKPKEILEEIHKAHGITLSYKQAWRGKERFMSMVRGCSEEEYRLLPQYCNQIQKSNPGSVALVYGHVEANCFHRLFVSYYASIYGFVNACVPIIGLDCTQLKNKYPVTLLVASGFDGDGAVFPLAFGVVDEENDQNWIWFLSELHSLLESNMDNMPTLTFLSNRQNDIVEAVNYSFPTDFHLFCMHYLSNSFRVEFNNEMLNNLLWEAAQAASPVDFEIKIAEIELHSPEAASWIRNIPGQFWASAYCEGKRFGHLTANIMESLNSWIVEASKLSIIQMMEYIRRQLMTWFDERCEMGNQWSTILVPSAEQKVKCAQEMAKDYNVEGANEAEIEVVSTRGAVYIVDIREHCCYCGEWQVYGLPCVHGTAALKYHMQNVYTHAEHFFTVATYRKAYSQTIHPILDKTLWDRSEVIINPPNSLRPIGNPRKKRVRPEDVGRVKRVVHCSRCRQTGHFRTTCTAPP